jgi:putative SOS response-associated peptidase YedK
MCHKYALDVWGEYLKHLKTFFGDEIPIRSEIFPGQNVIGFTDSDYFRAFSSSGIHAVQSDHLTITQFRWGLLPHWSKSEKITYSTYNARSESADTSPAFRSAFHSKPCLIPASGFFEFGTRAGRKTPFYFTLKERHSFCFAGIFDIWEPPKSPDKDLSNLKTIISCTILTAPANTLIAGIHDRMPVILSPENESVWLMSHLDSNERKNMCLPFPSENMMLNNPALHGKPGYHSSPESDLFGRL